MADRNHRAITGLSMGAQGALFLAIRHPATFGSAGSMSGGVDFRSFPDKWDIKKRLGEENNHQALWDSLTVMNLARSLKNEELHLIIDDGVQDIFIQANRQLHAELLDMGIDHDYTERPGEHNWAYWRNAVAYQLLFFHRFFVRESR